jgi:2-methylcitrate dehydratase PrpD
MSETQELVEFVANLSFDDLPNEVVERCQDLLLDWLGSALAGRYLHPTSIFQRLASDITSGDGSSDMFCQSRAGSAFGAAMTNAAAGNIVEQNDLHNSSILHPGAVVFPVVLALAQAQGNSGREFITAAVAGYEAGVRIGEFLGRSHYRFWHTTATVGTLAAGVAAGRLMNLDSERMAQTIGNAGTQAAGLWAFIHDDADSRQLHTAKAASNGLISASLARSGLKGAKDILVGKQGLGQAMSEDPAPKCLSDSLGDRWAVLETSLKLHASCRHTHPAADAFMSLVVSEGLTLGNISHVTVGVSQAALEVLNQSVSPDTISEAKFSMGIVLGLLMRYGSASVDTFTLSSIRDSQVCDIARRVSMVFDPEIDSAYPVRWIGKALVITKSGRHLEKRLDYPRGDPQNPLSEDERLTKFRQLASYGGIGTPESVEGLISWAGSLSKLKRVTSLRSWLA